jgi:hypothetical protein
MSRHNADCVTGHKRRCLDLPLNIRPESSSPPGLSHNAVSAFWIPDCQWHVGCSSVWFIVNLGSISFGVYGQQIATHAYPTWCMQSTIAWSKSTVWTKDIIHALCWLRSYSCTALFSSRLPKWGPIFLFVFYCLSTCTRLEQGHLGSLYWIMGLNAFLG